MVEQMMAEKERDDVFGRELLTLLEERYDIENASVMLITNDADTATQAHKKALAWSRFSKVFKVFSY